MAPRLPSEQKREDRGWDKEYFRPVANQRNLRGEEGRKKKEERGGDAT